MSQIADHLTYSVPGVSCRHWEQAITTEVEQIPGVALVDVDLDAKRVIVAGDCLEDAVVRHAIDEADYDAVRQP
jgi:copper chaperone CopZ